MLCLELGIKESIVVNDRMETSVPDIYAAGDAVQVKHYVTGGCSKFLLYNLKKVLDI